MLKFNIFLNNRYKKGKYEFSHNRNTHIFLHKVKNNYMLDIRSKTILNYLVNECSEGSYRVFETKELIGALPKKFKADNSAVSHCMQYLEKGNYISIKYKDNNMYCVSPLPFARQLLESESNQKQKTKKLITMGSMLYVLVFVFAFLGSFLAIIVYGMIF